ncbi:lipopolysaccharide assembly protein LapB [Thermosulfurimonas sp. F29]|uniref:tetratricopeptide repeat protein n=1 Tax=Thermosulfurimonas sp. F29 TaxID=2867247 RepID=UPI001C8299E2|nr:tetratricopeptide repeat protein [Thermosulfurimonas sp. F29]MBX6422096.1 tetratricopeptide repeat protein [Thermosulfurimonas sp. F29]
MRTTIRWLWKGLLPSLLILAVLGSSARAGRRAEAYYHFLVAVRAYQEGRLTEARKELYRVLRQDPRAVYPRKLLAEIYGRLGKYERAETVVRKALELAPGDPELKLLLARVYLSEKRFARAVVTLEEVLEKDPENERALGLLLNAYLGEKDLSGAVNSLDRLLKVHPDSVSLWLFRARLLARADRPLEAKKSYLRAVKLSDYRLEVVMEAGEFLRRIGALSEAENLYRTYLERNPEDFHARQALLQILLAQKRWSEAEKLLRETLERSPRRKGVRFFLGLVLEKEGRKEKALSVYREVPSDSPFYTDALRRVFALTRELRGDEAALNYLAELIRKESPDPQVYFFAATAAEDMDRCEEGLRFVDEGLKHFSDNRDLLLTKGLLLSCQGRLREALKVVEPLLERFPDDPVILNFVGYTYAELGEHLDEAEKLVRKALKAQPEAGYIVDSLAWVLYKKGRFEEALREIERAVKLAPDDGVILEHKGDILRALGRKGEACAIYRRALELVKHRRDRKRLEEKVSECPGKAPSS